MRKTPLFIGLDIGTSGCRAGAFDASGRIRALSVAEYPILQPRPGWAEQDPEVILESVVEVVRQLTSSLGDVDARQVAGIGLCSVFHSFIALGPDYEPLTGCITWADNRAAGVLNDIANSVDKEALYQRTGCRWHPMYPLAKAIWLRRERPDLFARLKKIVSIKDYVIFRLFGEFFLDWSVASGSGLFNIREMTWDEGAMALADIGPDALSAVVDPSFVLRGMAEGLAYRMGVDRHLPVVVGAGDGVLSTVGVGGCGPGRMTLMIGTSGAVRIVRDEPRTDPKGRTWCYVLSRGRWVAGAAINNGGIVYRWFRDEFCRDKAQEAVALGLGPYEKMDEMAGSVSPGAGGLIILPFLAGERSPYWNANARGVVFGLALHHGRAHVARAIMEGVAFRSRSIFEALEEVAGPCREIRLTGGFTRSRTWCQIVADVLGRRTLVPSVGEASALGAAAMAMWALGYADRYDFLDETVVIERTHEPDPENHGVYDELYGLYLDVYSSLSRHFDRISRFQGGR